MRSWTTRARRGSAERATAEALVEERRIEATRLGQERVIVAGKLERVRAELDSREREVLLADERRTHGEMRISQLAREREELLATRERLQVEIAESQEERNREAAAVESARERLELQQAENQEVRAALATEREAVEVAAGRARELAREIATAEAERVSLDRTRREADERLQSLTSRESELQENLEELGGQTELWTARADEVRGRIEAATAALQRFTDEVQTLRARSQAARDALTAAEDLLSRLDSKVEARAALERSYGGFSPAVSALMAVRTRFPAVLGPLADFVDTPDDPTHRAAVESFLGPLLQALVVSDLAAVRELRRWFREEWDGGGSLVLLPLDAPRREPLKAGSLRYGTGDGGDWVNQLLGELIVVADDPLEAYVPGAARIGSSGDLVDARGVVRLPEAGSGEGILARRKELVRLRAERKSAEAKRDARLSERDSLLTALAEAEARVHAAEEARRVAESERQRVELDSATFQHQRGRLQADREAVAEAIASSRDTGERAVKRMEELESALAELTRGVEEANARDTGARLRLNQLESRWEELRDRESELRVLAARAESDLRDAERRAREAEQARSAAEERIAQVEREAAEIRTTLEGLSGVSDRAGGEIEALFRARDAESGALSLLDARLAEVDSELAELGERGTGRAPARGGGGRGAPSDSSSSLAELRSRVERVRERLEVEWGRPWSALARHGAPRRRRRDRGLARGAARDRGSSWRRSAPSTCSPCEEHAEEDRRLRLPARAARRPRRRRATTSPPPSVQINRTARESFMSTFDTVRENFRRTFQSLFQGGECDIWLADPDDPLESPVEIQAHPGGKKTQRIHLLSGGERTLTALALLFAIYLVKPSPFCVLDEVDAPLDETQRRAASSSCCNDFKQRDAVHRHHPQPADDGGGGLGLRGDDGGAGRVDDRRSRAARRLGGGARRGLSSVGRAAASRFSSNATGPGRTGASATPLVSHGERCWS